MMQTIRAEILDFTAGFLGGQFWMPIDSPCAD